MPKKWNIGQTPCWRQSHFPLEKDGKEKGMVQKAKTKWGDVGLSEMVEGSSGVMSKRGKPTTCPPSALYNRLTASLGRSRAWQAQIAPPAEHHGFLFSISLIAT